MLLKRGSVFLRQCQQVSRGIQVLVLAKQIRTENQMFLIAMAAETEETIKDREEEAKDLQASCNQGNL